MASGSGDADAGVSGASILDLDIPTLGKVLAHLSPDEICRFSTLSRSLHQAVDEPLWKELFLRVWDDPVWPVESYKELFLERDAALGNFKYYSELELHDFEAASPAQDSISHIMCGAAGLEDMASHCRVLAAAVNASRHLSRTEETIRVNDLFERTCDMLERTEHYTKHNLRHREERRFTGPSMEERPTDHDLDKAIELYRKACRRAMYASSLMMSALVTRSEVVRASLLREEILEDAKTLSVCLWAAAHNLLTKTPFRPFRYCATDEESDEQDAYPVIGWTWDFPVHERETNDDAFAAALGGVPHTQAPGSATVPKLHKWERTPPSVAVALFAAPLALLGDGRESSHGVPLPSHPYLNPADPVPSDGDDRVPIIPNMPGRGPWPRGGRPPHGQRLRLERIGEPSTATSMSGSWFGTRLSISGSDSRDDYFRYSVDSVFRATLTVTPEGKVTGWIKDTVGNLTLRGKVHVDSEEQEVVLDGMYTDCSGLPGEMFGSLQHGRARLRLSGFASATLLAGDWTQFSGGRETRGVFCMWPNDEGKDSKEGMKRKRGDARWAPR